AYVAAVVRCLGARRTVLRDERLRRAPLGLAVGRRPLLLGEDPARERQREDGGNEQRGSHQQDLLWTQLLSAGCGPSQEEKRRTHRRARRRCHRGSRERERRRIPVQPRALRRAGPPVPPGSWLAAIGWRRLGLVDPGEAPAAGREVT